MVSISTTDAGLRERMDPVTPVTIAAEGAAPEYALPDTLATASEICETSYASAPGQVGTFKCTLEVPDGLSAQNPPVDYRLYWEDVNKAGASLATGQGSVVTATTTPAQTTLALPAAAAGTARRFVGVRSAEAAPGAPSRINLFPNPEFRSAGTQLLGSRYGDWNITYGHSGAGLAVGAFHGRITRPAAGSATSTSIILGYNELSANPGAEMYVPVQAGQQVTFSAYVRCPTAANGADLLPLIRFSTAGSTWAEPVNTGSPITIVANTWQRISYTVFAPAPGTGGYGDTFGLNVRLAVVGSISYAAGDHIDISNALVETGGSLLTWFDGTTTNGATPPASARWQGAAHLSASSLYASAEPGLRLLKVNAASLSLTAEAESLIGANLERDLRRSVADLFNAPAVRITAGTPGLRGGQLSFLCSSLAQALALDAVLTQPGPATLDDASELDGLKFYAVDRVRMSPERTMPGIPAKWTVQTTIREQP